MPGVAMSPGAGFAETAQYNKLSTADFPAWYEQTLWGVYDVPLYTRNLFNLPVVAYSGELDRQIQAARVMEAAFRYLTEGEKELWPIAIVETQIILTNSEEKARAYMNEIVESLGQHYDINSSSIVGKRVLIMWEKSQRKRLKKYLQQTMFWKRIHKYWLVDELG